MIHTFILGPIILNLIHISKIVLFLKLLRILIVKDTVAVKLIVVPFSIICRGIYRIVKNSLTIHLIFFKLTLIIGSVLKNELAISVLHAI